MFLKAIFCLYAKMKSHSLPHNDEKFDPQAIKRLVRPVAVVADVSERSLTLDEG